MVVVFLTWVNGSSPCSTIVDKHTYEGIRAELDKENPRKFLTFDAYDDKHNRIVFTAQTLCIEIITYDTVTMANDEFKALSSE